MKITINSISYYLPVHSESSESLKDDNPDWDIEKIIEKTGIKNRFIATPGESTLDIAFKATRKLFRLPLDFPRGYRPFDFGYAVIRFYSSFRRLYIAGQAKVIKKYYGI